MRNYKGRVVINRRTGERGIVKDVDDKKRLIVAYEGAEQKKYGFMFVIDEGIICFEDDQDQQAAEAWVQQEREFKQREEEMRRQEQMADIKAEEEKSRPRKRQVIGVERNNLIYKATYCDGGRTTERIGYFGVCSPEIMKNNIEEKRRWCSDSDCPCHMYYSGEVTYEELVEDYINDGFWPCNESVIFKDWEVNAGSKLTKKSRGKGNKITGTKEGGLCIITTRLPGTKEEDRIIIGLFLIDEVYTGDDDYDPSWGSVYADKKYRLEFTPTESANMKLWKYYRNSKSPDKPRWGTGLIRYCEDEIAVQILKDAISLKRGTRDEKLTIDFLGEYCIRNKVAPSKVGNPNGALTLV